MKLKEGTVNTRSDTIEEPMTLDIIEPKIVDITESVAGRRFNRPSNRVRRYTHK